MGFFKSLGLFLFDMLESGAKSTAATQYRVAQKASRDSSLSEEKREKAMEIAKEAKKNIERLNATQDRRDNLKKQLFDE